MATESTRPKPSEAAEAGGRRPPPKFALALAAIAVALWLGAMTVLALRTANPVTVNREQILASDLVVTGVPESRTGDRWAVAVQEVYLGRSTAGPMITVLAPADRPLSRGGKVVLPLRTTYAAPTDGAFEVTPGPPALRNARLSYPATAEVIAVVKDILATGDAKPYR